MTFSNDPSSSQPGIGTGLARSGGSQQHWPNLPADIMELDPILRLDPTKPEGKALHDFLLGILVKKLDWSERRMSQFYRRWRNNENRLQAYVIPKSKKEEEAQEAGGEQAEAPETYDVVVPYSWATISTICTYLMQTFTGRSPVFALRAEKNEAIKNAKNMETVIQYGLDSKNFARYLWNFLWNGQVYGLSILRTLWTKDLKLRTRWVSGERVRKLETVFEGNESISIDPFNFFPDPSVPMTEVAERGEFCFWRTFEGKHALLGAQADGLLNWVEFAGQMKTNTSYEGSSGASRRAEGDSLGESPRNKDWEAFDNTVQVDQGTVWIIPAELGLGKSIYPQRWLFTILNKSQIVQAEPYDADHDTHPISVSEPYILGQGFGNLGMADFLGPIQDAMSWLINSHMDNVREILNSTFVIDPSRLEMQDFKKGKKKHGRMIRLKSSAFGSDVRTAVTQLALNDVTAGHIQDMQVWQILGDAISGVNDNLRGLQSPGGRKTATEVRVSGEAGASRLATLAKVISLQALKLTAEQHIYNIQQYMSEPFYLLITGKAGAETPMQVFPEMLAGDFHYVPHDGTLPLDKVATVESWTQAVALVMGDPELRQQFDLVGMIEYVAELAGARGLDEFRVNVQVAGPGEGMPPGAMPIGGPAQGSGPPPQEALQQQLQDALGASAGATTGQGAGGPIGP